MGAAPAAAPIAAVLLLLLLLQLDAGVSEQVLLQSRDERSLLVVSYADMKVGFLGGIRGLRTAVRVQGRELLGGWVGVALSIAQHHNLLLQTRRVCLEGSTVIVCRCWLVPFLSDGGWSASCFLLSCVCRLLLPALLCLSTAAS